MRVFSRHWIYLLLLLLPVVLPNETGAAGERFYPLAQVRPGMKGEFLTVTRDDKIESFPIEVVGILKGSGTVRRFILIRMTGELKDIKWGIAAGMSGSPVFIDRRLVGAIGYGFQNADPRYSLVTPIEDMLELWDKPLALSKEVFFFQEGGLAGYNGVVFGEKNAGDFLLKARPVTTPLLLSDPNPRAYRLLSACLPENLVFPVAGGLGTPAEATGAPAFIPGSAFVLMLVDGDYQAAALGTVTWVEKERFLAFGHPFLNRGIVEYGAGGAYVYDIIHSDVMSFKMGATLPMHGRITRDRGAGVAGELAVLPRTIEVSVSVLDQDTGRRAEYSFQVVRDESLLQGLVLAGVVSVVDRALDRIGPGTATVGFQVGGENFPPVHRENLFYGEDIAVVLLNEIGRLLQLLAQNEFAQVSIEKISIQMEITSERLSARLIRIQLPKKEFVPGEEFTISGVVLPFRGTEVEIPLEIKIPEDFPPGEWLLSVQGSSYDMAVEKAENQAEHITDFNGTDETALQSITSLEELVEEFLTRPTNNELVARTFPLYPPDDAGDDFYTEDYESLPEKIWTVPTRYYLTGEEQMVIKVIEAETMDGNEKEIAVGTGTKPTARR